MGTSPGWTPLDVPATLHIDSWAGRRTYRVRLTGETRSSYRFEASEDIRMPRQRLLRAGQQGRAPKYALTRLREPGIET